MPVSAARQASRQAAHDARFAAARKVVPHGMYCYRALGIEQREMADGTTIPVLRTAMCPYWKRRGDWPRQANGYCRLLKVGDNSQGRRATMLLWDQVKECGVNMPTDEEFEQDALDAISVPS